jgi:hypothetical protein
VYDKGLGRTLDKKVNVKNFIFCCTLVTYIDIYFFLSGRLKMTSKNTGMFFNTFYIHFFTYPVNPVFYEHSVGLTIVAVVKIWSFFTRVSY